MFSDCGFRVGFFGVCHPELPCGLAFVFGFHCVLELGLGCRVVLNL